MTLSAAQQLQGFNSSDDCIKGEEKIIQEKQAPRLRIFNIKFLIKSKLFINVDKC